MAGDAKRGHVWVKYEGMDDSETAVAFGHLIPER